MNEKRLRQAKLLLDFYFAPWGAAKGAIWEDISNDRAFTVSNITGLLYATLNGNVELSDEQVKSLKIVVPDT